MAIAPKTKMDWLKQRSPFQARGTTGVVPPGRGERKLYGLERRRGPPPPRTRPVPPGRGERRGAREIRDPGAYEDVLRRTGYEEGFPGLERISARSTVTDRRQPSFAALDQPTAADLALMPEGGMPDRSHWLRRKMFGDIYPELGATGEPKEPGFRGPQDTETTPYGFLRTVPAGTPDRLKELREGRAGEPLSVVEQIYRDMGVFPGAETERVVSPFPFWEEKLIPLVPPEPLPEPDWYDGGAQDWWGGWGGWGGGGYTPQKAAARWWLNLTRWNI